MPGAARLPNSSTAASAMPLGGHTGAMLVCTKPSQKAAFAAATYAAASSSVSASLPAHRRKVRLPAGPSGIARTPHSPDASLEPATGSAALARYQLPSVDQPSHDRRQR